MKFNTYSIIAVCRETGCMGGAAASCFPGLGAFSPFIRISHGMISFPRMGKSLPERGRYGQNPAGSVRGGGTAQGTTGR